MNEDAWSISERHRIFKEHLMNMGGQVRNLPPPTTGVLPVNSGSWTGIAPTTGPIWYDSNTHTYTHYPTTPTLIDMLYSRLRVRSSDELPFKYISAHEIDEHRACVFVIHRGEPVTIVDDAALFPSDKLITQLRLLMG